MLKLNCDDQFQPVLQFVVVERNKCLTTPRLLIKKTLMSKMMSEIKKKWQKTFVIIVFIFY